MAPDSHRPKFKILSLDGGGAKGIYTLGVLKEVEAAAGRPLCEVFDMVFGTSTGAIIAALISLGYSISQIEALYLDLIPKIMDHKRRSGRTTALRSEAARIFGDKDFNAFKIPTGIVATNEDLERPLIFKSSVSQAHRRVETFKPGFGCTIAEAVVASCAAFPFFEKVPVKTANQGTPMVMDGGFVANNPTLFALADATKALSVPIEDIVILSVGVGQYQEPKKSFFHKILFKLWPFQMINKMFSTNSATIEQLRVLLFPNVRCVRVNESHTKDEYATDLLESDRRKLEKLNILGRESYAKFEPEIRALLDIKSTQNA